MTTTKRIKKRVNMLNRDPDDMYYKKHNNYAIPKAFMKRIIFKTLTHFSSKKVFDAADYDGFKKSKKRWKITEEALDLLHSELEKYATEIFMVAGMLGDVSRHSTLHPVRMKNAVQLRTTLIQTLG
jgi:hypothetical protein